MRLDINQLLTTIISKEPAKYCLIVCHPTERRRATKFIATDLIKYVNPHSIVIAKKLNEQILGQGSLTEMVRGRGENW
jgi:hypothetical protein